MSHQAKLEQILDLLINEETEKANELAHQVLVEKAREIYESLVEEDFGGDMKSDFADEIEADKDEIEADEVFDGDDLEGDVDLDDVEDVEGDEEETDVEELEDRVEDLEALIAELRAEYDRLMSDDLDGEVDDLEGDVDDLEGDVGVDDFEVVDDLEGEELEEATKLSDTVPATGQEREGKLAGTGAKSKVGATGKESPYTRIPPRETAGEPTDFVGKDESGEKAGKGTDKTPTNNIDVDKKQAAATGQETEGKPAGTGKGTKTGPVNPKSPLGQSQSPRGGVKS